MSGEPHGAAIEGIVASALSFPPHQTTLLTVRLGEQELRAQGPGLPLLLHEGCMTVHAAGQRFAGTVAKSSEVATETRPPVAEREDLGKFTHEGRYRVWKEIWMLNYFGRAARYEE